MQFLASRSFHGISVVQCPVTHFSSHGHGYMSHLAMVTVFWPKMENLDQKLNILVKRIGQKCQKLVPEVTDGHYGGLGRG